MDFKVVAKQHGNSVEFEVNATDVKAALAQAKHESGKIFDYNTGDEMPVVSVKPIVEKD